MTVSEFNNQVIQIIGRSLDLADVSEIKPESALQQDLGMSSLAILTMVAQLEDEFDILRLLDA